MLNLSFRDMTMCLSITLRFSFFSTLVCWKERLSEGNFRGRLQGVDRYGSRNHGP